MTLTIFEKYNVESKVLIIGTGPSAKSICPYINELKDYFDVIIGINSAIIEFESVMRFHMIPEENAYCEYRSLNDKCLFKNKDTPRIINSRNIGDVGSHLNIFSCDKIDISKITNFRLYSNSGHGGLAECYDSFGTPMGTAMLQAIHFATILGASGIYIIGSEFCFSKKSDRYYNTKVYSNKDDGIYEKMTIHRNGRKFDTIRAFYVASTIVDSVLKNYVTPLNINVYDFSNGLLMGATKLKIEDYFEHH